MAVVLLYPGECQLQRKQEEGYICTVWLARFTLHPAYIQYQLRSEKRV